MRFLIAFALVSIIFLAGCASYKSSEPSGATETTGVQPTGIKHTIEITSSGFSPRNLNIGLGDTLVFVNKDTSQHQPASDIHPTHNVYPDKGGCVGSAFDACKGLKQNEKYEFTFLHSGRWCYHDHLNPDLTGCVNVQ